MLRKLGAAVVVLGVIVAALLAPFAGIERSNKAPSLEDILFDPSRSSIGDWTPSELQYRDIVFSTEDGVELHGWLCDVDQSRGAILFLHGNAGNIATRADWIRRLQRELQLDVFIFDYRGYGRSEGKPTVDGLYLDVLAAHDIMCEELSLQPEEVILMGESIGGAYATWLTKERPPKALILYSVFSSAKDMARVHYPQHASQVPSDMLNSVLMIKEYKGPLLQIHGTDDRIVPISLARKLNRAYTGETNSFFEHANVGHNDLLTDAFIQQLDDFINRTSDGDDIE